MIETHDLALKNGHGHGALIDHQLRIERMHRSGPRRNGHSARYRFGRTLIEIGTRLTGSSGDRTAFTPIGSF